MKVVESTSLIMTPSLLSFFVLCGFSSPPTLLFRWISAVPFRNAPGRFFYIHERFNWHPPFEFCDRPPPQAVVGRLTLRLFEIPLSLTLRSPLTLLFFSFRRSSRLFRAAALLTDRLFCFF